MSKKAVIEKTRPAAPSSDAPAPPAYFLSVSVENFRCFGKKQTFDLSDGNGKPKLWTIVLGDNGIGKTTLLQIMAMLRPVVDRYSSNGFNAVAGLVPAVFIFDYLSGVGPRRYSIKQPFGISEANISAEVWRQRLDETSRMNGPNETIHATLTLQEHMRGMQLSPISNDARELICYGYGASRRPSRAAIVDEQSKDTCASLFDDSIELINAEEWLVQADYAAGKGQKQAERRLEQVKNVLMRLLPDVEDFKFEHLSERTYLPVVQAKTPYGWVPVRSLSLGYQSLITWTVDLASCLFARYPDSENPLAEPAVVLVDEIDLHLHPKWQRTLMQTLSDTFPKTQFIVTAHSPLVVQSAPDANIVVLRREGDHVVIDNDVKVVEGWRADQILTSDLFGLSSARPPEWDALLDERDQILAKHDFSEADQRRLTELENQIAELPTGETPSDREAMDIIRRAATMFKSRVDSGK